MKACTKTGSDNQMASLITVALLLYVHFNGEAWINLSELQLGNLPLLFVVLAV